MNEKDIDMSQVHDGRHQPVPVSRSVNIPEGVTIGRSDQAAGFALNLLINEAESESEHEAHIENMAQLNSAIDVLTAGRNYTSLVITIVPLRG